MGESAVQNAEDSLVYVDIVSSMPAEQFREYEPVILDVAEEAENVYVQVLSEQILTVYVRGEVFELHHAEEFCSVEEIESIYRELVGSTEASDWESVEDIVTIDDF